MPFGLTNLGAMDQRATPKDEYPMSIADMLVDSTIGNEILSLLDSYLGYNQIYIAENGISKIVFRCTGALGTYEWIVMPFGLRNVGAMYQRATPKDEYPMQIVDMLVDSTTGNEILSLLDDYS